MMEKNTHRNVRMSRKLLITCILVIAMLAMSGLTYAATGKTITEHVKVFFSDGPSKDIVVVTTIDENGDEAVEGNEIYEEHPLDENGEGGVKIQGDGWEFETGFYKIEVYGTPEGEEQDVKGDSEDE